MTNDQLEAAIAELTDKWDEMAGCDQPSITDFNDGKRIAYDDCADQLRKMLPEILRRHAASETPAQSINAKLLAACRNMERIHGTAEYNWDKKKWH